MVKKRLSGQTIAIVILAVLLLLAIGFGGVYAFYTARSNKVSGQIVMANLKITLESGVGDSGKTEVVISNGVNVIPGQKLENSPLIVNNLSSVPVYLAVVYELNAVTHSGEKIKDNHKDPVLGVGFEYINSSDSKENVNIGVSNRFWVDYVFQADSVDHEDKEDGKLYRCFVTMLPVEKEQSSTVIEKDSLSLAREMGNEYQNSTIFLRFQAFAIGSAMEVFSDFNNSTSASTKCQRIVEEIYKSQDCRFLYNVEATA